MESQDLYIIWKTKFGIDIFGPFTSEQFQAFVVEEEVDWDADQLIGLKLEDPTHVWPIVKE